MTRFSFCNKTSRHYFLHCMVLATIGIAVYANALHGPFLFDDEAIIIENGTTANISNFFNMHAWRNNRALGLLSFAVNRALNGTNPFGYHLVNLVIHLASTLTLYFLVSKLLDSTDTPSSETGPLPKNQIIPLITAALFVAHPIQTQAVSYITQRFTSMATLFYLLSILAYASFRTHPQNSTGRRRYPTYVFAIICTLLAMRSKEIAFTLPVAIVCYEWIFISNGHISGWKYTIPFIAAVPLIPMSLITPDTLETGIAHAIDSTTHVATSLGRFDYFATECRVLITYMRLLFFPVNQNLDYDYPIYTSLFAPPVFISACVLLTIAGCAIFKAARPQQCTQQEKLTLFGILLFLLGISVESSFIPIRDVIFEHRLYLPSSGAFLAITTIVFVGVSKIQQNKQRATTISTTLLLLATLIFSIAAHERNKAWQSEWALTFDTFKKSPNKARPLINMAAYYIKNRQPEQGMIFLRRALQVEPASCLAWYNMGMVYGQLNKLDEAEQMYRQAIKLLPGFQSAYAYLAWTLEQNHKPEQALSVYKDALLLNSQDFRSINGMRRVIAQQGQRKFEGNVGMPIKE